MPAGTETGQKAKPNSKSSIVNNKYETVQVHLIIEAGIFLPAPLPGMPCILRGPLRSCFEFESF
jgi:hypothetical protein